MSDPIKQFPIQSTSERGPYTISEPVYMTAYEVYSHVYAPQKAIIEGDCRGGFGVGELVAFLYAKSFPKEQWSARVYEAFKGMKL